MSLPGSRSGFSLDWPEILLSGESVCTSYESTDPSSSNLSLSLEECSAASRLANSCSVMSAQRYCSPSGWGEFARWADGALVSPPGRRERGIIYGDVGTGWLSAECMAIAGVSPKIDTLADFL